ncbi:MAG: methyltransferase domain-containing protein [Clostridiales bacterium]|nr:methyltransferase domain-containing protein [Clostridiales bacterium]
MEDVVGQVRAYYDQSVEAEYARIDGRPEFLITRRFLDRYAVPGARVLDVGGGPGRYAHYLAARGCDVTLYDLSEGNVAFARARAEQLGLKLTAIAGDAREADAALKGPFDCVLLMGPMYHLLTEADRVRAVSACLNLLKPGGTLFVSFITMFSGVIYMMRRGPELILSDEVIERRFRECVLDDTDYAGPAFTQAYFIRQRDILPFMARFALNKLHLLGQEGILAPCEPAILAQPPEVVSAWVDLAEALCEREEFLSWAEHILYVGRKRDGA